VLESALEAASAMISFAHFFFYFRFPRPLVEGNG
jgi:hypothetical protein